MSETIERCLYPVLEVAKKCGVGRSTVYALIAAGELAAVKIGRRTLVPAESLDAYIERLTKGE